MFDFIASDTLTYLSTTLVETQDIIGQFLMRTLCKAFIGVPFILIDVYFMSWLYLIRIGGRIVTGGRSSCL